ncbi:hypothetical protein ACFSL6_08875 [Paenibacillus thailandensis]|uniref:Uncharacterized protein n=1 Tax=Paenibacillus thailandensis TaxID=393250 RepID=A0ABW5QTF8_9BACL
MAKTQYELAAEITQAVIQAKGAVIANASNHRKEYLELFLSDEAVAKTFKTVLDTILEPK